MTTALALPSFASFQPNALVMREKGTIDEYEAIGFSISMMDNHSNWWRGDLLLAALALYGDDAYQCVPEDHNIKKWMKSMWVCKAFPPTRRRVNLSFAHHETLARYDDPTQDEWLDKAEEYGWTVAELRAELRGETEDKVSWQEKFDRLTDYATQALALLNDGEAEAAIERLKDGLNV